MQLSGKLKRPISSSKLCDLQHKIDLRKGGNSHDIQRQAGASESNDPPLSLENYRDSARVRGCHWQRVDEIDESHLALPEDELGPGPGPNCGIARLSVRRPEASSAKEGLSSE
ncbi:hypothetical protein EAI_11838 [Harpegnathos saltator]|uniref:Uncharacterized protein n=1 Tax=Harpegnathos saltator TaxID=610380 RepID=E2C918_HARSA|nr:hypothetical protein EAI_11838 [Harpegnathos saltator]